MRGKCFTLLPYLLGVHGNRHERPVGNYRIEPFGAFRDKSEIMKKTDRVSH
jgi:hypothetical protein